MSRVAQMALLGSAAPPAATISYIALTAVPYNSGGNCAISGVSIGAAAFDRRVFMIVHWLKAASPAPTMSAATIGGVAATIHVQNTGYASASVAGCAIISAAVAAGTTADVTLTFTGAATPYIGTYRVTGLLSTVAGDTISSTPVASSSPHNDTIDVTKNGVLLFGAMLTYNTPNYTITGATENYESSVSSNTKVLGSCLEVAASEAGRTLTITGNGSGSNYIQGPIVGAAFR